MSTKHTPGPWYAARPADASRNGSPILAADRSVGVYFAHGANGEANARLISSAPDLLAALGDIVSLADKQDFWLPRNWLSDARAAIAKAEGRA